ncbi:MAG: type VI secretion system membrane subunit TssM [Pyrinomonadaceae bacterium]|nr:type VI secretion system membrane subunit TssM [Pyrinomonadaceae bacterium]
MNSWHIQQLKFAFGIGSFMSFYGIVGLIVVMLPAGTASYNQKIVVIAMVLLTMPLALVGGYVVNRRSKKKAAKVAAEAEAKGEVKTDGDQPKKAEPAAINDDINKSTEEVVQFLKTSNLGEVGKDAVYSLPWYLVAGTPRSGKSSLVMSSNLNFQNLPSQRQSEQKFVRSTASIDWRVTSDAVFVDTAGRYQTEGGAETPDADEWASLLETIKKHRKARPLDGFLLVANAEKILSSSDEEVEQMAKVLRTKLDDAMTRTKIRFPIYLIFTNADSIEGFRDSFSSSKGEGKNLVWGATIPIEKSENAQTLFDGEYEILHNSLMKRRLMRLSAPFPPVRQLRIFNFPLHFGSARRKLGGFVSTLFRPNPFSESPFLRGFYFTAVPTSRPPMPQGGQTMPPNAPQTIGQSFFTEKLFRDVVLRDKDLVRTLQEQRQRPPILGWVLTALSALVVLALLTLAGVSLYNNKQMLDNASEKAEAVLTIVKSDANKNPLAKNPQETTRELNAAEDLRVAMEQFDNYERNGAPFYMRMGLYSGNRMYKEKLLPIYFNVIEQRFKAPTVAKIESELRKFNSSAAVPNPAQLTVQEEDNLGKNYDLLKAYLMLSGDYKDKANGTDITNALKNYWTTESKIPAGMEQSSLEQLDFWAKQVDREEAPGRFPRITLDKTLVDATRKKLQAFPPVFRYYKNKVTEVSKEIDEKIGETTVEGILTRNGADTQYVEGTYKMPSAYTLEGYKLMKVAIDEADTKLSADDWVMGEQGKGVITQTTDASKLNERYMRDYADQWRNFVKGVKVKPYTKENAKPALQAFSSANSPIKILVQQIVLNTNFSAKPVAGTWWETITGFWSKKPVVSTGGGTQVEKDFLPLFSFMGEAGKPSAPIDAYQGEIGKVSNRFSGFSITEINQLSQDLAKDDDKKFPELRSANTKVGTLLGGFNATPAGQEVATLLKKPLENLSSLLGADAQTQLEKAWKEQLLPQAKEIEKGFPFEDGQNETDLTKLTAYLNPENGSFSKFYKDNVQKYFDGNPGQLKLKDTSPVKFSDDYIAYLNKILLLRDALFQKSATPNFEYEFKLSPVTDAILEGTIDGQPVKSDASVKLKFPASGGTETGVNISLASSGGTVSTSGTTPPAAANTATNTTSNTTSNTNSAPVKSPAQNSNSSSSDSSASSIKKPGTWGLFRFFNDGTPKKEATGEYTLTYKLGSKTVTAVVKPSGGDLFDKDLFKTVRAPDKFLK